MPAQIIKNNFTKPANRLDYSRSIMHYERTHTTNILTGKIVPVGYLKMMPGDTAPNKFGFILQSAPLLGPSFDNVYIDIISIWTPIRLVLANHNEWLGDNDTYAWTLGNNVKFPKLTKVYTCTKFAGSTPYTCSRAYWAEHYLAPHIGFRFRNPGESVVTGHNFATFEDQSSLYHDGVHVIIPRIYDLTWNSLFRNENIQAPILFSKQDGVDLSLDVTNYKTGLGELHNANRLKNVYTMSRPAPSIQSVDLGLNGTIKLPVGVVSPIDVSGDNLTIDNSLSGFFPIVDSDNTDTYPVIADLANLTVNSMYYAIMLQKYMNKASNGRRPVEFYQEFFGVTNSEVAHTMPELLSQKRYKVNISRVVATANSTDAQSNTQPLGSQGAYSVTSVGGTLFPEFTATEYGYLMVYAVIRNQESFASGIDKDLTESDLLSTYLPVFDHIGNEAVEKREFQDSSYSGTPVFGYQEAWYRYRYFVNDVVGIASPGEPLGYFTLARNFTINASPFAINSLFIQQTPFEFDRMLQFPVCYGSPNTTGYDENGEPFNSARYQWLLQFALAGDFARTMSKDSEPLLFGNRI